MSIVIFRLLDRQPTDSKQIGEENKALDFAVWYEIKNPFFVRLEGGVREEYRYIQGSKFLKVSEQVLAKEVFNPVTDVLGFSSGEDIMVEETFDEAKVKILRLHPWNPKSPYHISGTNPKVFEEWSAVEEAKKELSTITDEDDAMDILRALRNDQSRLKTIAYIFDVSTTFSDEEMYLKLRAIVKEDPKVFINSIANKKNDFLANIRKAIELNVITYDLKGYSFTKEGGLIMESGSKKPKENEANLIIFLMGEEGAEYYKQILVLIEHAEIDLNNTQ